MTDQDNIPIPALSGPVTKALIRPDRCELCKFAAMVPIPNDPRLECHARPPAVTAFLGPTQEGGVQVLNSTAFPLVQGTQWCGEFRPKVLAS